MGEPQRKMEKRIGVSNPDASIWESTPDGQAIAPPPDAVPRRDDDAEDDYDPNDDGPDTEPVEKG
jgi:hypothetical protein